MVKKKKNNMTIIVIVIVSIVIVGGVLTWGFLTEWGQGKKSEPVKYTVTKKIPKGNKIEIENPESHGFKIGQVIEIGTGESREIRTIVGFGSLILDRPLTKDYPENTVITVVEEPIKKDFKVDNCKKYNVDLTCKECGDSYYLQDNKCKKYSYTGTKDDCNKNKGIFTKKTSSSDQTCVDCEEKENKWVDTNGQQVCTEYKTECGDGKWFDSSTKGPTSDATCYDVVESREVLANLIKTTLPAGDEYIRTDGEITKNYGPMRTFKLHESITDLHGLFKGTYKGTLPKVRNTFNKDISGWDVSNVTNMSEMFMFSGFNGDISKWNVGNVTTMRQMFRSANFNKDISDWDVRKVTDMYRMFSYAREFNQPIGKWKLESIKNIDRMLFTDSGAVPAFYQDLNSWCPYIKKSVDDKLMGEIPFYFIYWRNTAYITPKPSMSEVKVEDSKLSKIMWYFQTYGVSASLRMTQAMKTKYTNAYNNCEISD